MLTIIVVKKRLMVRGFIGFLSFYAPLCQGFLISELSTFGSGQLFIGGSCSVYFRIFSSTPDLYPPKPSSIPQVMTVEISSGTDKTTSS